MFPIEIMLSPLDSHGGIPGDAAIRDITTRRRAETLLLQNVEELRRSNERPDLILLDLNLPRMTAARCWRSSSTTTP